MTIRPHNLYAMSAFFFLSSERCSPNTLSNIDVSINSAVDRDLPISVVHFLVEDLDHEAYSSPLSTSLSSSSSARLLAARS